VAEVLLVYPYSRPRANRSSFRFPPLGLAYVASALRQAGYGVDILDGTFLDDAALLEQAEKAKADLVGVYSMITMKARALEVARRLRGRSGLLVAGGPLPSTEPAGFLGDFDVAVRGEGERTILELVKAFAGNGQPGDLHDIDGLSYRNGGRDGVTNTADRVLAPDLDTLPFPARDLLPNAAYLRYGARKYGHSITSVMTSRGCPFSCEFCSNAVFRRTFRKRSAGNVVDEVEQVLGLGYERVHFADDVFTLDRSRLLQICSEIEHRGLHFEWECLARVDSIDREIAAAMRSAGCYRVFFGIESGVDEVLTRMGKRATSRQALQAVEAARSAGLRTGGFFILCYPGETDDTVLQTIRFATRLPLDYLSFTMPYPIPGTKLYERVGAGATREWLQPSSPLSDHVLTFDSEFSERKMKFGIMKGRLQFLLRHRLGRVGSWLARWVEWSSDRVFRLLK
jgi:anaerobic magnesium-protoporphyrin IX monomethyl ester cyclase